MTRELWDVAQRLPRSPNCDGSSYLRSTLVYEVAKGQWFFRSSDNLLVFIDFVTKDQLVIAINAYNHEVYRCYVIDFSAQYVNNNVLAASLQWTRLSKKDALALIKKHKRARIKEGLKSLLYYFSSGF